MQCSAMARGKKRRPGKFDDTNGAARQRMKKIAKNEAKAQQQLMRDFAASKLPKKQRRKAAVRRGWATPFLSHVREGSECFPGRLGLGLCKATSHDVHQIL